MTLSKEKIKKIHELRDQGLTIRKIAKRLRISTDSACKYSRPGYSIIKPIEKDISHSPRFTSSRNNNIGIERHSQPTGDRCPYSTVNRPRDRYHNYRHHRNPYYVNSQGGFPLPESGISFWTRPGIPVPPIMHKEPEPKVPQKSSFQILQEQRTERQMQKLSREIEEYKKTSEQWAKNKKEFDEWMLAQRQKKISIKEPVVSPDDVIRNEFQALIKKKTENEKRLETLDHYREETKHLYNTDYYDKKYQEVFREQQEIDEKIKNLVKDFKYKTDKANP